MWKLDNKEDEYVAEGKAKEQFWAKKILPIEIGKEDEIEIVRNYIDESIVVHICYWKNSLCAERKLMVRQNTFAKRASFNWVADALLMCNND